MTPTPPQFPLAVKVETLNRRHALVSQWGPTWERLGLLYRGGAELLAKAGDFLVRRPKEPREQITQRLQMATYQNVLGSACAWYSAKLFSKSPSIRAVLPGRDDEAWVRFKQDATRGGMSLLDFAQEAFKDFLVYGRTYYLIDLPLGRPVASRAEEIALGMLSPYVLRIDPGAVINFAMDSYGRLEWALVYGSEERQADPFSPVESVETWTYYTRTEFARYERETSRKADEREARLVAFGPHALADISECPVRVQEVPHKLWFGNRAYPQAVAHFNADNALAWHLHQSNLAMPVIFTNSDIKLTLAEAGYMILPEGAKFEWTEPPGNSIVEAAKRCASLREELYRSFHLQAQGRSSEATPAMQSGYSKELDIAASGDILEDFGNRIAGLLKEILRLWALARGIEPPAESEVSGFEFQESRAVETVDELERAREADIPSDSLLMFLERRAGMELAAEADEETRSRIQAELAAAPTPLKRAESKAQVALDAAIEASNFGGKKS